MNIEEETHREDEKGCSRKQKWQGQVPEPSHFAKLEETEGVQGAFIIIWEAIEVEHQA